MFRAIGIGHSRSLTSAAALNWVLKDGLGRFSRCIYTASLASAFDTNLKVRASQFVLLFLSSLARAHVIMILLNQSFAVTNYFTICCRILFEES